MLTLRRRASFPPGPPNRGDQVLRCVLLLVLVCALLRVAHEVSPFNPFNDRRFDPVVWRAHTDPQEWNNPRGQMIVDLQRHYLRPGLTQADVTAILGPPNGETTRGWSYDIGSWSGFGIDPDTVELRFDAYGRLIESVVVGS